MKKNENHKECPLFFAESEHDEDYDGLFSGPVCYKLFLWVIGCWLRDSIGLAIVPVIPIIPISPIKITHPVLLAPIATRS